MADATGPVKQHALVLLNVQIQLRLIEVDPLSPIAVLPVKCLSLDVLLANVLSKLSCEISDDTSNLREPLLLLILDSYGREELVSVRRLNPFWW